MRRDIHLLVTASKYELIQYSRNRLAMVLIVVFVPLWVTLAYYFVPEVAVPFRLRATGQLLSPAGNELAQITGAINGVSLIAGFMMFAATFANGKFDRRLVMAGYPRLHLALAKLASLTLSSAFVAAYATAIIAIAWTPRQPILFAIALLCVAMSYGALGVIFGSLLRREVEGMFAMVMTSVIDVSLQNPSFSAGADNPLVRFLPSFGAVQAGTAAGFSNDHAYHYLAIQLLWFAIAALISLLTFHRRTRNSLSNAAASASGFADPPSRNSVICGSVYPRRSWTPRSPDGRPRPGQRRPPLARAESAPIICKSDLDVGEPSSPGSNPARFHRPGPPSR